MVSMRADNCLECGLGFLRPERDNSGLCYACAEKAAKMANHARPMTPSRRIEAEKLLP